MLTRVVLAALTFSTFWGALGAAQPPPPPAAAAPEDQTTDDATAPPSETSEAPPPTTDAAPPQPTDAQQPPGKASAPGDAKAAFAAGVEAYEAGDYPAAAQHFSTAQAQAPHPDVLLNLAQSQLMAGDYPNAATHFRQYLSDPSLPQAAAAAQGLEQAKQHVSELTVLAPDGATLKLDEVDLGTSPLPAPVFVMPGPRVLFADSAERPVQLNAGEAFTIDFRAKATPAGSATAEPKSPTPSPSAAPAASPRESEGRQPFAKWFVERPIAWIGAGVAAGALVTSTVAGATSARRYDQADDAARQIRERFASDGASGTPCGPPALDSQYSDACDFFADKTDEGDTWKTVSIVTLIVGVATAGGVATYYFLDSEEAPARSAQLVPVIGAREQGLFLTGSF